MDINDHLSIFIFKQLPASSHFCLLCHWVSHRHLRWGINWCRRVRCNSRGMLTCAVGLKGCLCDRIYRSVSVETMCNNAKKKTDKVFLSHGLYCSYTVVLLNIRSKPQCTGCPIVPTDTFPMNQHWQCWQVVSLSESYDLQEPFSAVFISLVVSSISGRTIYSESP